MIIKTKLSSKDLANANLAIYYSKTSAKIYTGVFSFLFLASILLSLIYPEFSFSNAIPFVILPFVMPVLIYVSSRVNFSSKLRISEPLEYNFADEYLSIKGDSFSSQLTWNKLYKVTKTKNWLLIWQNTNSANVILLRDITPFDTDYLKEILDNHKVKNNL